MLMFCKSYVCNVNMRVTSVRGIRAEHAARLARVLSFLDRAAAPADVDPIVDG